ncbi:hypothetical protein GGR73_003051 [Xanthomonas sp. F14]
MGSREWGLVRADSRSGNRESGVGNRRSGGWGEGTGGEAAPGMRWHEASPVPSSAPAGDLLPQGEGRAGGQPELLGACPSLAEFRCCRCCRCWRWPIPPSRRAVALERCHRRTRELAQRLDTSPPWWMTRSRQVTWHCFIRDFPASAGLGSNRKVAVRSCGRPGGKVVRRPPRSLGDAPRSGPLRSPSCPWSGICSC